MTTKFMFLHHHQISVVLLCCSCYVCGSVDVVVDVVFFFNVDGEYSCVVHSVSSTSKSKAHNSVIFFYSEFTGPRCMLLAAICYYKLQRRK